MRFIMFHTLQVDAVLERHKRLHTVPDRMSVEWINSGSSRSIDWLEGVSHQPVRTVETQLKRRAIPSKNAKPPFARCSRINPKKWNDCLFPAAEDPVLGMQVIARHPQHLCKHRCDTVPPESLFIIGEIKEGAQCLVDRRA